ncbi:TAXI family TRAP transporter solute-binding subunit [Caballeronia sp. J97]|uniref:TAXI family TRAP transporter solute-binding subunit n=1 Tax=Caballeronia sp. J97 TaxID=2805429 RepID=UPI002AAFA5A0|nr:TAXI family TRAP transporter solute-binding subunit [Caballeronia sp. J97]
MTTNTQSRGKITGPRIDFKIMADWGNANFHAIAGWIMAHLRWQSEPGSDFWIKTGTGYADNIRALVSKEVDLTITTPFDVMPEWATAGTNFFADFGPAPSIRSLGWLPQNDRLVFAIREDTGITSFKDLRDRKFPLKLASGFRTHDNVMMWAIDRVLEEHGIEVEAWGGKWLEHDHPRISVPYVTSGEANAVINEAIVVPQWRELVEKVPMRFLAYEPEALAELSRKYGLRPAVLPAGYLRTPEDVACLDWSNWAILVRDDMDDDLAYLVTSIMVEERAELEGRYRHMPPEIAAMTYPINPEVMWTGLGAPLHPGAERYYREHGYMR